MNAAGATTTLWRPLAAGTLDRMVSWPMGPPTRRFPLWSGGGPVDTTGAWLVGAKGEYPLHRPYLPPYLLVIATTHPATSAPLAKPLACQITIDTYGSAFRAKPRTGVAMLDRGMPAAAGGRRSGSKVVATDARRAGKCAQVAGKTSEPSRDRTGDPLLKRQLLYRLS